MEGIVYQTSLLFTIFVEITKERNLVGRCLEIPMAIIRGKILQQLRRNVAEALSLIQVIMPEEKEASARISNIYKKFYYQKSDQYL